MSEKINTRWTRRHFLGAAALGVTGVAVLPGLTSCKSPVVAADKDLILGFIGLGRQAMFLLNGFLQLPGVKVVAGSDVYGVKNSRFAMRVQDHYAGLGETVEVATYENYADLISREDIDVVVIATPDHSHAMIAIAAANAKKDIYLEKPLTFTIKEGQELVKAVRQNNVVLQVGSQQRSDANFQHAVNLVQSGTLGSVLTAHAYVGAPPIPYNLPEETLPADLNWDAWLGPLPASIHYNKELNPPISLDPVQNETIWGGWRWYKEMGGGFTTDWGAHMFDIVQWAFGMDSSGPVEISPVEGSTEFMTFKYANGSVMTSEPFDEKLTKGVKFIGENGWIEVSRGHYEASNPEWYPAATAEVDDMPYETRIPHQVDFVEAVRSRKDPVVTVEIGHRTCTVCTLGNIAVELGRTVKWDPSTETFVDDTDGAAAAMLHYDYRSGWSLL